MAIILSKNSSTLDRNDRKKIGIRLPLDRGSDGYFSMSSLTKDAVRDNLVNLLKTETGERIFNPEFGLRLKKFLFEPVDETSAAAIQEEITSKVQRYLPIVQITNIVVNPQSAGDSLDVTRLNIKVEFLIQNLSLGSDTVDIDIGT